MPKQTRQRETQRTANLEQVAIELMEWRQAHRPPTPIPDRLWDRAAGLARRLGVGTVARALGLNHTLLKRRLETPPAAVPTPSFVELFPPVAATVGECAVELKSPRGSRVRIVMKDVPPSCLAELLRELAG